MASKTDRVYLETLKRLTDFIDENFEEAGFIPSEHKMSEMLGVSRGSYRAALSKLSLNGTIISYPKKGHFVIPKRFRSRKVGIVIGQGHDCPHLPTSLLLTSFINRLREHEIDCQFIHASAPENIKRRAITHGVRALSWFFPNPDIFPVIYDKEPNLDIPHLIVTLKDNDILKTHYKNHPYIISDALDSRLRQIRFLKNEGHDQIAVLGSSPNLMKKAFDCIGMKFKKQLYVEYSSKDWEERLRKALLGGEASALITSGLYETREKIFRILQELPQEKRPVLLVPNDHFLTRHIQENPKINVIGKFLFDLEKMGNTAADEIAANVTQGCAIQSHEVTGLLVRKI